MQSNIAVLDVRTRAEYMGGHVAGSLNIPLLELDEHLEELKNLQKKIIVCCASGTRSSSATKYLRSQGITCENGGSWMDVNFQYSFT
jgi:phage shock protein E